MYVSISRKVEKVAYEATSRISAPLGSGRGSYAARLIPGYTTLGSCLIEGKYDLKTRAVNNEFARMTSACPRITDQDKAIPTEKELYILVVTSSNQSIGILYILLIRLAFFLKG